jgi:hypothetical protein
VNGTEVLVCGSDNAAAIFDIRQVSLHKEDPAAIRMQIRGNGVPPFCVAPANDKSCRSTFYKYPRNCLAQALRTARHNRILAT